MQSGMRRLPLALAAALACSEPADPAPEVPAVAYCEEVASWDPDDAAFEREVLELVNQRRAEGADCEGGGEFWIPSDPLTMHPALRCAARKHSLAMIAGDYFEHESPDGEDFQARAAAAEYDGEPLAQSIAAGHRDPAQVVATLMSNDGNCANLMNPEATELGVGYLPASDVSYSHYWTLVFGRR
jgi:uncharacterized protein YkwD